MSKWLEVGWKWVGSGLEVSENRGGKDGTS